MTDYTVTLNRNELEVLIYLLKVHVGREPRKYPISGKLLKRLRRTR